MDNDNNCSDTEPNIATVEKIASLALLSFTDAEKQAMLAEFKALLAAALRLPEPQRETRIESAPTELSHLREDITATPTERELLLGNAKEKLDGCFTVPRAVG